MVPENYKDPYLKVKNEFFEYLNGNADFVGGLTKKANYNIKNGNINDVITVYEKAIDVDNLDNRLRITLSNLHYNVGHYYKAKTMFKYIVKTEPDYGYANKQDGTFVSY